MDCVINGILILAAIRYVWHFFPQREIVRGAAGRVVHGVKKLFKRFIAGLAQTLCFIGLLSVNLAEYLENRLADLITAEFRKEVLTSQHVAEFQSTVGRLTEDLEKEKENSDVFIQETWKSFDQMTKELEDKLETLKSDSHRQNRHLQAAREQNSHLQARIWNLQDETVLYRSSGTDFDQSIRLQGELSRERNHCEQLKSRVFKYWNDALRERRRADMAEYESEMYFNRILQTSPLGTTLRG